MKRVKYSIHSLLAALLVAIVCLATSCTSEAIEKEDAGTVIKMMLDGGIQEFDATATRAATSWPNGSTLLIRFSNGAYGKAQYSSSTDDWSISVTGSLSATSSASCTVYYSPNPKSSSATTLTLDHSTPLYTAQGTYSYASSALKVSATLKPATTRVRFKGTSSTSLSLSGMSFYSSVDVSKSTPLSTATSNISLTVSDSYTDYVYGFLDASCELSLTTNDVTYKRTIGSSMFVNGQSGYIDIPTSYALGSWTKVTTGDSGNGTENGHEYVDLGLSVKWATCNVGASSPEDYGDYYAWGETQTKSTYDWSTYKWMVPGYSDWKHVNKYQFADGLTSGIWYSNGTFVGDNKTQLDPEDDVAHVKWKGTWRMPTDAELTELRTGCTWTWTSQGGKNGYKVTSKKNGNFIFMPAAGYRDGSDLYCASSYGEYWSSSLFASYSTNAYYVKFDSGNVYWNDHYRYYGLSVRPVCPNSSSISVSSITLNQTSLDLTTGSTYQLSATVNPSNASNKSVTWSSSNTSVVTVSSSGVVTAKAAGSAAITATAADGSGVKATCSVTVTTGGSGNGSENGHDYVDLGLSVKWATCNVGASSPEDYGDHYAWGETETKSTYSWSTYLDSPNRDGNSFTKYYNNGGKTQLLPEDDVAHVKWKGSWRMPTKAEQDELREQCTWTWTSQGGTNGYKVTSKKNGNSIFLPAAGCRHDSGLDYVGSDGLYWSSSLSTGNSNDAYDLYFFPNSGHVYWSYGSRYYGRSVRPVCP